MGRNGAYYSRLRARQRVPVTGIEYICVQGVEGMREAGVLNGVRAMVARVYGGEEWHVNDEGCGRAECLYEKPGSNTHTTQFIVARRVGDNRWERHAEEQRGVNDEIEGVQEDDYENEGEGGDAAREERGEDAEDAIREEGNRRENSGPAGRTEEGEGGREGQEKGKEKMAE